MTQLQKFYDAFEMLDIKPTLDATTINEAFRIAALNHHPDRFFTQPEKEKAHSVFVAISNSHDFLLEMVQMPEVIESFDVAPLSIGVEESNGLMKPIIRTGTIIPCESFDVLELQRQTMGFSFDVFQGVRPIAKDNHRLLRVSIIGVSLLTDMVAIRAQFQIDEYGLLHIAAYDIHTGKQFNTEVADFSGAQSNNDIVAHKDEARQNRASDKRKANDAKG